MMERVGHIVGHRQGMDTCHPRSMNMVHRHHLTTMDTTTDMAMFHRMTTKTANIVDHRLDTNMVCHPHHPMDASRAMALSVVLLHHITSMDPHHHLIMSAMITKTGLIVNMALLLHCLRVTSTSLTLRHLVRALMKVDLMRDTTGLGTLSGAAHHLQNTWMNLGSPMGHLHQNTTQTAMTITTAHLRQTITTTCQSTMVHLHSSITSIMMHLGPWSCDLRSAKPSNL